MPIIYTGILPDLFREGQGVVTEGMLEDSGNLEHPEFWRSMTKIICRLSSLICSMKSMIKNKSWSKMP